MFIKMTVLASAVSGLVYTSLPAPSSEPLAPAEPTVGQRHEISQALEINRTVPARALVFERINVDGLMGAPVIDGQERFVGHVSQLMVAEDGRIEGLVLYLDRSAPSANKEIAVESGAVDVLRATSGAYVVQTDASLGALNAVPAFVPEYEQASAS